MDCRYFLASLSELLDTSLDAATAAEARAHAAVCPACRAVWASSRQTVEWLGDGRFGAMPEAASIRLRQRLERDLGQPAAAPQQPARDRAWSILFWLRPRWAAALVLILLTVGVARWQAGATTVSGWLIDQNCATNFHGDAAMHTSDCLRHCAARGVALGLLDAKGHFRRFDAKGTRSARAVIAHADKPNHLWVTVKARAAGHGVLDVEQLALTTPPDAGAVAR
jgi:hypothetical protein